MKISNKKKMEMIIMKIILVVKIILVMIIQNMEIVHLICQEKKWL